MKWLGFLLKYFRKIVGGDNWNMTDTMLPFVKVDVGYVGVPSMDTLYSVLFLRLTECQPVSHGFAC